eukprot:2650239-Prymnesium_polylepis.1
MSTTNTGISLRSASSISIRHHGRVSTPFVAKTTIVSHLCTPSVMRLRKSLSELESKNTGDLVIFRSMSCRYRASDAASAKEKKATTGR